MSSKLNSIAIILLAVTLCVSVLLSQTGVQPGQISPAGGAVGQVLCLSGNQTTGALSLAFCPPVPPAAGIPHRYSDQPATLQADCSYTVANPLVGSVPDANSIQVVAGGLVLTTHATPTLGTIDYTLDPTNPLHVVPTAQTVANWGPCTAGGNPHQWEVRLSFDVVK